jgi:hypothetical protein
MILTFAVTNSHPSAGVGFGHHSSAFGGSSMFGSDDGFGHHGIGSHSGISHHSMGHSWA